MLTDEQRLTALEQRVEVLESERPGRKPRPLLAIRQRGVCGIDPTRDSGDCPDASIYRYQSGCHGDACRAKQHEAYERRKGNKPVKPVKVKAVAPTKKAVPKTPLLPTAPTKRVAKRVTKKAATPTTKRASKRAAA
jgi:hypothetical protein